MPGTGNTPDPSDWSDEKIDEWFEKADWLNGWSVKPDQSIDRKALAISYYNNQLRWNQAFQFLTTHDLTSLAPGNYQISGKDLYAIVSEYMSKSIENARFEAHKNYVDLQYVISGSELMGITPLAMQNEIKQPYDPVKDVVFVSVHEHRDIRATPSVFFLFFPNDIHRPGLMDGVSSPVRKIVVKIKID